MGSPVTVAARAEAAFRADMARELAFLQPLDPEERVALAGLLRKLIAGIEADSSMTVSRQNRDFVPKTG